MKIEKQLLCNVPKKVWSGVFGCIKSQGQNDRTSLKTMLPQPQEKTVAPRTAKQPLLLRTDYLE